MHRTMASDRIERWRMIQVSLRGPEGGAPFLDVQVSARFKHKHRVVEVDGFYDGEGVYRIRFMPDQEGAWSYATSSNCPELDSKRGEFACVAPSPGNHGPVVVSNTSHFAAWFKMGQNQLDKFSESWRRKKTAHSS